MDVNAYNREAWNRKVATADKWTIPVSPETIAAARRGEWSVVLTPTKPVPRAWFGEVAGARVLCLASAGGQQAPVLAAAGARVTSLDQSPAMLAQDRLVATREGLALDTVEGDMRDLSRFADGSFDLVFHAVSNCFVSEVRPMWREVARVLRPGGVLLAGFANPIVFAIDPELEKAGDMRIRYGIPYSDITSLTDDERRRWTDAGEPLCFGHTLEDQIGGQCDAGLAITAMFDDGDPDQPLTKFLKPYVATRSVRS